jgi:hypothetical protein
MQFGGKDTGVLELEAVSQVDALPCLSLCSSTLTSIGQTVCVCPV